VTGRRPGVGALREVASRAADGADGRRSRRIELHQRGAAVGWAEQPM